MFLDITYSKSAITAEAKAGYFCFKSPTVSKRQDQKTYIFYVEE